ncbi:MAG: hypothetical protein ACWIPJ_03295 [Polaribacter sp.]
MKLTSFLLIAIFGTFFVACTKEISVQEYMVGSWQTTYLKMEMPTYQTSDSLEIYEDKFENNSTIVTQSKYNKDGTFSTWFINKKGTHSANADGKWNVKGDSLFVSFFYNGKTMNVTYHITPTNHGFTGKSTYDWDNDGSLDDTLIMKTKRIKTP